MGSLKVLLWLLPKRLKSSWMLLAVAGFGALASVTIMAVGAGHSNALAEGGLIYALETTPSISLNVHIIAQNRPLEPTDYPVLRSTIEDGTAVALGYALADGHQRSGRTTPDLPFVQALDGTPPSRGGPVGQIYFLTDIENHSRLTAGRWPSEAPVAHDGGLEMETVVGVDVATRLGWDVGTKVFLLPFAFDPSQGITLDIVGVAEPLDAREEYWAGQSSTYFNIVNPPFGPSIVPVVIREGDFFRGLGQRFPLLVGNFSWLYDVERGLIDASLVQPTIDALSNLETDLNKSYPRTLVLTALDSTLKEFQVELLEARVGIFLFVSMVGLVILYFLAVTLSSVARIQSAEAGLFKSRGASGKQLVGLMAAEWVGLVLAAMALGPLIAWALVKFLLAEGIDPAGLGRTIPVGLSKDMYLIGALGGVLSLVVIAVTGAGLARIGLVEFLRSRSRPPEKPIVQRYYLDLLVLVVVGFLWWQIEQRGGFLERDVLSGALEGDLTLRLGPVLLLLGAALFTFRLVPFLYRSAAWLSSVAAPAWVDFALRRAARDPVPYGAVFIMLMVAAAVGVFAATFQSTVASSSSHQSLYWSGGDLALIDPGTFHQETVDSLAALEGVEAVSPFSWFPVRMADRVTRAGATLVALDPATLPETAWFRSDFADDSLEGLMASIRTTETPEMDSVTVPLGAETIGVWVDGSELREDHSQITIWARVSDSIGIHHSLILYDKSVEGEEGRLIPGAGWTFLEGSLPSVQKFREPFGLVSIFATLPNRGSATQTPGGVVHLDDVTAKGPGVGGPDGLVIEGFESELISLGWRLLPNAVREADVMTLSDRAARSGAQGIRLAWARSMGQPPKGIFIPPGVYPLPAIGGPGYVVGQHQRIWANDPLLTLDIRATARYFPTLDPGLSPFLIVSHRDYNRLVSRMPNGKPLPRPTELWLGLDSSIPRSSIIESINAENVARLSGSVRIRDSRAYEELAASNPLEGGGWNSLALVSLSSLTLAVALALGIFAAVSVRTAQIDLTVVRALGFSRRQLIMSLAVERLLSAVLAVGMGAALGYGISRWTLGLLDTTLTGRDILPPMITTYNGMLMTALAVDLGIVLAAAVLFTALMAGRLDQTEALRSGQ